MALADYISDNFPTIKAQLNWSDSVTLPVIVDKALELYGVATELLATDLVKLHSVADVAVWRQALNDISLDYNWSADGASFSRSQAVDAIRKNLDDALSKAIVYLPYYQMVVHNTDQNPDWTDE
jgi:hypothetical protein